MRDLSHLSKEELLKLLSVIYDNADFFGNDMTTGIICRAEEEIKNV
jgi:hypothetical protein